MMLMRFPFIFFFFLLVSLGCTQSGIKETSATTTASEGPEEQADVARYSRLEGVVAGQPVVVHWHYYNKSVYCSYYYVREGKKIELYTWEDSVRDDQEFYLTERSVTSSPAATDPHWKVSWTGERVRGTWFSGDNNKSYPIELKETYSTGSHHLSLIYVSDSARLIESKPEPRAFATTLTVKSSAFMPSRSSKYLDSLITTAIRCTPDAKIEACIVYNHKKYFSGYRKEAYEMDTAGLLDSSSSLSYLNYSTDRNIRVNYNDNDLLVLEDFVSEYSGGAHGNYGSSFLNIDLKDQQLLSLADIINPADTSKLLAVLQQCARTYLGIKPNEALSTHFFDDAVPLTANFYLTHTGITFVYNPYEIAAYAAGQINIFVPFPSIKEYMTPSFRQRIRI